MNWKGAGTLVAEVIKGECGLLGPAGGAPTPFPSLEVQWGCGHPMGYSAAFPGFWSFPEQHKP